MLSLDGSILIEKNGRVAAGACQRLFGGEFDSLAWTTFTSGPMSKKFSSPLVPMGRAGTITRYGNKAVAVWLTAEDGSLKPVAVYNGSKGNFIPNSATEFVSVVAEAKLKDNPLILETVKFPKIVIGFPNNEVPDADTMDQDALAAASGKSDPAGMMLWFTNNKRVAGDHTFIRYDLFPEGFEIGENNPIFEDFTGLIDDEGYAKPQIVYQDALNKYGMRYKYVKDVLATPTNGQSRA